MLIFHQILDAGLQTREILTVGNVYTVSLKYVLLTGCLYYQVNQQYLQKYTVIQASHILNHQTKQLKFEAEDIPQSINACI